MALPQFAQRDLYGGAITASLPKSYIDASDLRQIPDHQEVFVSSVSGISIIFDILTRAQPPEHPECVTDEAALRYHYDDLVSPGHVRAGQESEEETHMWQTDRIVIPSLGQDTTVLRLTGSQHPRDSTGSNKTDATLILLLLVRLKAQETDFLITVNVPFVRGEYDTATVDPAQSNFGDLGKEGQAILEEIVRTLRIQDWDLFVTD